MLLFIKYLILVRKANKTAKEYKSKHLSHLTKKKYWCLQKNINFLVKFEFIINYDYKKMYEITSRITIYFKVYLNNIYSIINLNNEILSKIYPQWAPTSTHVHTTGLKLSGSTRKKMLRCSITCHKLSLTSIQWNHQEIIDGTDSVSR